MFWPDTQTGVDVEPARKTVQSAVRKYFTEGGVGVPPTVPGGDWFNQITNELLAVLADAGISPSKVDDTQLLAAIKQVSNSTSAYEALRRSYADAGYTLIGSFDVGCTVTDEKQVILLKSTGVCYEWTGSIPTEGYVVDAGIDPISNPLFSPRNDDVLLGQLTSGGLSIHQIGNKKSSVSTRVSWFADSGDDITSILPEILADVSYGTGILLVDVNCKISSFDFSTFSGLSEIRFTSKWTTITQVSGTEAHMLIMGDDQVIVSGRLRGDRASQDGVWFGAYFNGVSGSGVIDVDIRGFSGNGVHFIDCEDTFCRRSTIRDIGKSVTEYACGQYVSNCINHESERNDIRDVFNNGIKFRADTIGLTKGCSSIRDKVKSAGRIGIASGSVQDHVISSWYCVDCGDNGVDVNGSDNVDVGGGTSRNCLDGVYMGENGMTRGRVHDVSCIGNRRAGFGSLGSLTNCSVYDFLFDANGSGAYCSGFNGLRLSNGRIANSVVQDFLDNGTGLTVSSTGNGVDIQTNLSDCHKLRLQSIYFQGQAGKNISLGSSGILGDSLIESNSFESRGVSHVDLGGATLVNNKWRGNFGGWQNEIKKTFTISSAGSTTLTITFSSEVNASLFNSNFIVEAVIPDWGSTFRIQSKSTSSLIIEFGTATPSANRRVDVVLSGLLPNY